MLIVSASPMGGNSALQLERQDVGYTLEYAVMEMVSLCWHSSSGGGEDY